MRISPDSYSFYTFGLVLSCGISMFRNRLRIKQYALISGFVILFLTLLSKLISGYSIEFSYIAFMMMLVVIPAVKQECRMGTYDFYHLTVFLSLGVILAALCAMEYAGFSNIAPFIRVDNYNVITRRCGFYGDPNFYCAQITAALGGCMLLLLRERQRKRVILLLILSYLLVYCGALSGSKSFALVTCCIVVLWIYNLLQMKNRPIIKVFMLAALCVLVVIVTKSDMFRELIDVFIARFSRSTDLESFTTHRTELWEMYLEEIFTDIKVFFLGRGFSNIKINTLASHNSILQMFFELGMIGAPFLLYWNYCFMRDASIGLRHSKETMRNAWIVIVGVYLPWMAIDILFFDEYFLFQWYVFMAMQYAPETLENMVSAKKGNGRRLLHIAVRRRLRR